MSDDFCPEHGRDHMKCDRGPIPYCTKCEPDWAAVKAAEIVDELREYTWSNSCIGSFKFDVPHKTAVKLLAERLRLIHLEGQAEGIRKVQEALKS